MLAEKQQWKQRSKIIELSNMLGYKDILGVPYIDSMQKISFIPNLINRLCYRFFVTKDISEDDYSRFWMLISYEI